MIKGKTLIIWDWNGTLLDDRAVCIASMNRMLTRRGMPLVSETRYQEIFRFPVKDYYIDLGFDFEQEPFESLSVEFIAHYRELQPAAPLYTGAVELLNAFRKQGLKQIILSAMERGDLVRDVSDRGITPYFEAILGAENHLAHGKAAIAREYLVTSGLGADEIIMLGDTEHDYEVSALLGCTCILISQGHHDAARLMATGARVQKNLAGVLNFLINP
jgi:phosphoglycolate phosphatase